MEINQTLNIQKQAIKLHRKISLHIIRMPILIFLVWCIAVVTPFFIYFFIKNPNIDKWKWIIFVLSCITFVNTVQLIWLCLKYLFFFERLIKIFGTNKTNIEIIFKAINWPSLDINKKELKIWLKNPKITIWFFIPPIGFVCVMVDFLLGMSDIHWGKDASYLKLKKKIRDEINSDEKNQK